MHIHDDGSPTPEQEDDSRIETDIPESAQPEGEPMRDTGKRVELQPRQMMITKFLIKQYGKSAGCPACDRIATNESRAVHSDACRVMIMKEMEKTAAGRQRLLENRDRIARQSGATTEKVSGDKRQPNEDNADPEVAENNGEEMEVDDEKWQKTGTPTKERVD